MDSLPNSNENKPPTAVEPYNHQSTPSINDTANNDTIESDEALARRLQEEYDREQNSVSLSSPMATDLVSSTTTPFIFPSCPGPPFSSNPPPVAPFDPNPSPMTPFDPNPSPATPCDHNPSSATSFGPNPPPEFPNHGPTIAAVDPLYAQYPPPNRSQPQQVSNAPSISHRQSVYHDLDASAARALQKYEDELYSQRIQQSLYDEQLAAATQQRYYGGGTGGAGMTGYRGRYRRKPFLCYLPTILVLCGAGYFIYYFTTGRDPLNAEGGLQGLGDIIKRWDDSELDGEWDDGQEIGWKPNSEGKKGLLLTIENACSDDWIEHFEAAVTGWDDLGKDLEKYGNADVITLQTRRIDRDLACAQSNGVLKVCNDNYGDTGWKGINEVRIQGGYITSSIAKMNEYYLGDSNGVGGGVAIFETEQGLWDERRYTMCHEMGHGLGLGHADTNFHERRYGDLYGLNK
uniref:Peptidase M10 metallopeptidase domain-containing protein n=1 Tax=Corethron hystrix TaxID=216773 RepID=A0A7S1FM26_9STRA|mmetsp:Transcript_12144/g.26576  ORF Transcript_12144/g.26576 Transcript_12144/m.26576 type:complete len:460 (+) Transcript_12144:126-1505(+)